MATWCRPRSLRTGRLLRHRRDSDDETVQLDFSKDVSENIKEILCNIVKQQGVSKGKKLGYLNAFVKLCEKASKKKKNSFGFSAVELFSCLRLALLHEAKEVRAAGLRAMRYLLYEESMMDAFLNVQLHHLVCRSLDIVLDNQVEHIQCLRLMRKMLNLCPQKFPSAFARCLIAISVDGFQERERLQRICLATLSELALLNADLFAQCGGVDALIKCTINCQLPRINDSLVATIIYLMNHPKTRRFVRMGIDLEQVLAAYTDCHYRPHSENLDHSGDEKELIFVASKLALLSILRSWPGMIRLCKPDDVGIKSLVNILYLPNSDIRKGVLELIFMLFRLPVPEWTDDFSVALLATDPLNSNDSWKLYEGFVAEEGMAVLPHIAEYRTNLIENYLALLLLAFISNGLLEALIEVITTSDIFVTVRATFLLGELLHLANKLLPHECNHHSHCLPTLMAVAASFDAAPQQRHIASAAITYLNSLHALKNRGPIPFSLFLDQLIQFSSKTKKFQIIDKMSRAKLLACLKKDSDDFVAQAIKDSHVLNSSREFDNWDWMIVDALLKMSSDSLKKLDDNVHRLFIRKLIHFYKPTSKLFSHLNLNNMKSRVISVVGSHLMDFLVDAEESEASKFLGEFLTDFGLCLGQITTERSPLDAILCPNRVLSTNCQFYFLFVGRLCHSLNGRKALEVTSIYQYLLDLVSVSSHDCYTKLIVSSLDYSKDGLPRIIFTKILTGTSESCRLYATNFMRVLVRLHHPEFHRWGIELLVSQLYDKSRAVSLTALDVLDEACELQVNLESVINLRPSLLHLGDRGLLLLIRFLSRPSGFKFLLDANFAVNELERWKKTYNLKYVKIVEDELNDSITRHQRGKDGTYGRRTSQKHVIRDVFVPHHLYGQLAQHKAGLDLLREHNCVVPLIQHIKLQKFDTAQQILELKASLWALGQIGTSDEGVGMLSSGHVIPEIVKLGEECPVYSIRGTCFYVLGLLASTRIGTDMLSKLGWESLCRRRSEMWPLVEEPDFIFAEDSLSSVGSLSNQLGELDADDGCSSTLARLDEDDIGEDLRIEENSFNSMHQTFNELNDFGVLNRCNDNKSPNQETSPMESKSHSPSMRDDTIQIRSKFVSESTNSDLSCKSHPASSPVSRIGNAKSPCYKWSNTLPLVRTKPLTAESLHNSTVFTESECSRQRSRSMTQRPHISETITEAWERRNKVVSSEINCCSGHSSPRGSTRVPPRLKITSRERIRCDSLNDGIKYSDIDSPSASSVFCRGPRHLRSSSNIEIGQCRVGPHVSGMQSEYGDTVIPLSNASFKDRRSDSNESSHTSTSKSRSNSCTDSTSGFSSCESNNIRPVTSSTTMERPQLLSPIASSSSLNTMSGRTVHHSDPTRKLVNLRKTPVILCRVSAPVNLITNTTSLPGFTVPSTPSLSPDVHTMESFAFTTTRDAQGYATLRSLRQRRRGFSTCVVPDQKLLEYNLRAAKTRSLDSRLEIPRLLTYDSLSSLGLSNFERVSLSHSTSTQNISVDKEEVRYVGLCLPVDIGMIFNEDCKESQSCPVDDISITEHHACYDNNVVMRPHMEVDPNFDKNLSDGLELHTPTICIGCFRIYNSLESNLDTQQSQGQLQLELSSLPKKLGELHNSQATCNRNRTSHTPFGKSQTSNSDTSAATTPGSLSSISTCDLGNKINSDSLSGKALLRKEVLRLIINLSSSVATKSAEQGLLNLKQKFPNAFQDLCLYSEITHLMALYKFRLSARRFIQELFMDMTFNELYEEPLQFLGLYKEASIDDESNI